MFRSKTVKNLMVAAILGSFLLVSSGCSWKPSDEEKQALEDAKSAAQAAEQKRDEMAQQVRNLENQLNQKNQMTQNCEDEKAATAARVANWQE
ncbi:MAG: hypothetical protein KDI06_12365 [Calditrichaeota bacterium]|nr:hypothetical protein [Calditrichota bacterium]HQU72367.1 hypothetical protein [Calditrichia bacterium]